MVNPHCFFTYSIMIHLVCGKNSIIFPGVAVSSSCQLKSAYKLELSVRLDKKWETLIYDYFEHKGEFHMIEDFPVSRWERADEDSETKDFCWWWDDVNDDGGSSGSSGGDNNEYASQASRLFKVPGRQAQGRHLYSGSPVCVSGSKKGGRTGR
jgi:hypothetical protein